MFSGDHAGGHPNVFDQFSLIHVADGCCDQRVSPGVGGEQHRAERRDRVRRCQPEARREPAFENSLGDGSHSVLLNIRDALIPCFWCSDFGGCVAEDQRPEAARRICSEPLADDSANGQTTEMHLVHLKLIEQGQNIVAQGADRACFFRQVAVAVAAHIVAQEVKLTLHGC